jgi:hypothetical protein
VCGPAGAGASELVADVDHGGGEVDVGPAEREYLGEAHAGVDGGCEQRPVADRAAGEQPAKLVLGEYSLPTRPGVRSLVRLESAQRVLDEMATPHGEAEDAPERDHDSAYRPGRETLGLQVCDQLGELVGCDQLQTSPAKRRQQVPFELVAIKLKRALPPCAGGDLGLELRKSSCRDLGEGNRRR